MGFLLASWRPEGDECWTYCQWKAIGVLDGLSSIVVMAMVVVVKQVILNRRLHFKYIQMTTYTTRHNPYVHAHPVWPAAWFWHIKLVLLMHKRLSLSWLSLSAPTWFYCRPRPTLSVRIALLEFLHGKTPFVSFLLLLFCFVSFRLFCRMRFFCLLLSSHFCFRFSVARAENCKEGRCERKGSALLLFDFAWITFPISKIS